MMLYRNERLLCKFVSVRAAKWRLSTNYVGSVMQSFDYKRLNSVEHTSAQETGRLEEKLKTFISCKGSSFKEVFSLLGISISP